MSTVITLSSVYADKMRGGKAMRRSWMIGAVGLAILVFATTASAAIVGHYQRMRFERSNGATFGWVTTSKDSPTDANHRALKLVLKPNAPGCSDENLQACSYGRAFSTASSTKRMLVGDQRNLSWEYAAANPVTASERMNVFFSNGDVAFLDSSLCNKPIASSGGTWLRSDFTGFKTGCSFSVAGETAGVYAADGTHSAWAVYAAAWPDQVVTIRHLLVDSGAAPATGTSTYYFDRISLGAGKMYTRAANRAVSCPTEAFC